MDEKLIFERLKEMTGGKEQALFRQISKVFSEIVKYSDEKYENLEKRLSEDVVDEAQPYYIYGTIAKREDAAVLGDFLFPMCGDEDKGILKTIYLQCEQAKIRACIGREFWVRLTTADATYRRKATLQPCKAYLAQVERLHSAFCSSGVSWLHINIPYLYKFMDVVYESQEETDGSSNSEILAAEIELEEMGAYARYDLIPFWNVQHLMLPCVAFPTPQIDSEHYEHPLIVPDERDGYLADSDRVEAILKKRDRICVISTEQESQEWSVLRIVTAKNKKALGVINETYSNKRNLTFGGRKYLYSVKPNRTKTEVFRLFAAYDMPNITLRSVEWADDCSSFIGAKLVNGFIPYKFCQASSCRVLLFLLEIVEEEIYLEEKVSFLMAEMENYFPEYRCFGKIL